VGDALSRLPTVSLEEEKGPIDPEQLSEKLSECLLFYPEELDNFPLQFPAIAQAQEADPTMLPMADQDGFEIQVFHGTELICYLQDNAWKIVLPESMIEPTIAWYHIMLGHCGTVRLANSLLTHLWFPNARPRISTFVSSCEACQRNKQPGRGYGHLPPKNDIAQPWEEVAVDLIGPWTLRVPTGDLVVHAITMIDITTTLTETVRIENKTSSHCALQFENHWLSRYPRPLRCVHDQGTEFVGLNFQHMLAMNGIQSVPTTVRNPQANAVCERMHKTVQDMLNSSLRDPPDNVATAIELVDTCLAAASRALRSAVHQSMQISPGALVFHRDMLLPIPLSADYNEIRIRRQAIIDENNRKANLRRHFKDYSPGDQVLILLRPLSKLGQKTMGPFPITQVHINGTVTIER
jgi:transposase InsO family protein